MHVYHNANLLCSDLEAAIDLTFMSGLILGIFAYSCISII